MEPSTDTEAITGSTVKDIRNSILKVTQEDMALILNLSTKTIERWESEKDLPINPETSAGSRLHDLVNVLANKDAQKSFLRAFKEAQPWGAQVAGALLPALGTAVGGAVGVVATTIMHKALSSFLQAQKEKGNNPFGE